MSTQIRSFDILPGKVATVPDGEVWYIVDLTNAAIDQTEALETTREDLDEKTYVTSGTRIYTTGAKGRVSYILFDTAESTADITDDGEAPVITGFENCSGSYTSSYYRFSGTLYFTCPNGYSSLTPESISERYKSFSITNIKLADDKLSGSFDFSYYERGSTGVSVLLTDQLGKTAGFSTASGRLNGIYYTQLSTTGANCSPSYTDASDIPGALIDEWITATVVIDSPCGIVPPGTFTGGHSDCVQVGNTGDYVEARITDRVINWDSADITMEYRWIGRSYYGTSSYYIDNQDQYIELTVDTSNAANEVMRIPIKVDKDEYYLGTEIFSSTSPLEVEYVESTTVDGSVDLVMDIPFAAKYGLHTVTATVSNTYRTFQNLNVEFDENATSGNFTIVADLTKQGPGWQTSFSPNGNSYPIQLRVYFKDMNGNKSTKWEDRTVYIKGVIAS